MTENRKILDGKALSKRIKSELKEEVEVLVTAGHRKPHLAAVLIGDNPASKSYIRGKIKSCKQVGFESTLIEKSNDISQEQLLDIIDQLNTNPAVDGYIVQLPLPDHIDEDLVNLAIDPDKDVDGFHPYNLGKMMIGLPTFLPATPYGIIQILDRYEIETSGKNAVILGRSQIVGTPLSILLSRKMKKGNATVTMVHSRSKNVVEISSKADILISAIGRADYVTEGMVKEGAVVIDVGINRVPDESRKRGYRLVGDVDYEGVYDKVSKITPVPGGVGPMTICSLMKNALLAATRNRD